MYGGLLVIFSAFSNYDQAILVLNGVHVFTRLGLLADRFSVILSIEAEDFLAILKEGWLKFCVRALLIKIIDNLLFEFERHLNYVLAQSSWKRICDIISQRAVI